MTSEAANAIVGGIKPFDAQDGAVFEIRDRKAGVFRVEAVQHAHGALQDVVSGG
ncbi:hypothetical protein CDES_11980 [Corynebacterium deserti GIMN1.010]|uniref:Uncharacterized protein n=1 Tax=Corynebacterium deserti GIMN1.010 TaxID=931089 RepID=A0A0M4CJY0_9CORY|nr:hypothetical protein [Corynebacterium deserti]ALC06746.1 hypothetical protein CDES_11980 [Corynebacterium deserti GIMN1.010]